MKFLLIAAAVVAVAVAGPARPPIFIGPNFVGKPPISVGPAIIEPIPESPISVGPAIVEQAPNTVYSSPLVQVIVNVKPGVSGNPEIEPTPVQIAEQPEAPEPVLIAPIQLPEIVPTPVIIVDHPEVPEPVIIAPIDFAPVITLPGVLN